MDDANELFEKNIPLAIDVLADVIGKMPKDFVRIHHDDMKQEALIGLWKASSRFDGTRGTMFSTYAVPLIRGEIYNYIEKQIRGRRNYNVTVISLETPVEDGLTIGDMLSYRIPEDVSWIFTDTRLDEREKQICKYLYEGYKQSEIARMMGYSYELISRLKKKIASILSED